ncbi:MAG: sugar ABC transporter permease [Bacilli bacterium]
MEQNYEQKVQHQIKYSKIIAFLKKYGLVCVFLFPYLSVFCVFFIYPFIYGTVMSFFSWQYYAPENAQFVGFDNYASILFGSDGLLYSKQFYQGLTNSFIFTAVSVPFLIIVPFFLAVLINMKPFGHKFFQAVFFLPTVLGVSTVCYIFLNMFDPDFGFISKLFEDIFGTGRVNWLTGDAVSQWFVIILTTIWWTIGTNMVIMGAGLKQIDKSLYEAASIDGCSSFSRAVHITIPSIKNQIIICLITTIIGSFNVFGQPYILTQGGSKLGGETYVLLMRIRALFLGVNTDTGIPTAMAVVLGLIIIAISLAQLYLTREKKGRRYAIKKYKAYKLEHPTPVSFKEKITNEQ